MEPAFFEKDVAQNPGQAGKEKIVQSHCEGVSCSNFEKFWNVLPKQVTHATIDLLSISRGFYLSNGR